MGDRAEVLKKAQRLLIFWDKFGGADARFQQVEFARALIESEREIAAAREPITDTYACQRCGRRDGLDAVVPDDIWVRLSEAAGDVNILCLWCMDALAARIGIECAVELHFAGAALYSISERAARLQAEALNENLVNAAEFERQHRAQAEAEAAVLREALEDAVRVVGSSYIAHVGDHTSHIAHVETERVERWRAALSTAPERAKLLLDVVEAAQRTAATFTVSDCGGYIFVPIAEADWLVSRLAALDAQEGT